MLRTDVGKKILFGWERGLYAKEDVLWELEICTDESLRKDLIYILTEIIG